MLLLLLLVLRGVQELTVPTRWQAEMVKAAMTEGEMTSASNQFSKFQKQIVQLLPRQK